MSALALSGKTSLRRGGRFYILAVAPSSQGQGIGAALTGHSESFMAKRGAVSYLLYTNELMHENIDWYRNSGFREIARRKKHAFKRVYFEKTIHQP
jgi:ribosomal protein S18 acetylase RimI-like enzyme